LLPGSSGSAVVVTSRAKLADLETAHLIELGEIPADEAVTLLGTIAGLGNPEADPGALAAIAARCGYLPLALRVAGARLAFQPVLTPAALADALAGPHPSRRAPGRRLVCGRTPAHRLRDAERR
jgi:hypothetical protein